MKSKKLLSIVLSIVMVAAMFLPISAFAAESGILVSNCDSISGWSCYPGDGAAVDTSVMCEGKGSVKFWQTGGFCGLYKLPSEINISSMKYFTFNMLPQAADWFEKAGYAYLVISSRQDSGGYAEPDTAEWNDNALLVNLSSVKLSEGWNTISVPLDFSAANAGFDPTRITKIGIFGLRYYERSGENVNYIDNVRFTTEIGGEATAVDPLVLSTEELFDRANEIYSAGNRDYTQSSYDKFVVAYEQVKDVDVKTASHDQLVAARKTLQSGLNTLTSKTNPHALTEDYKRVVVVGIDGMGAFDADQEVSTPNLDRIRQGSDVLYTHTATSVSPSISAQNWSAMLLGVSPQRHGNTNESIEANETPDYQTYPSIFKYLRNTYPEATMGSIVNWNPINYGVIEHNIGVDLQTNSSDTGIANLAIDYWKQNDPIMTFLHFDSADHEGHTSGYQKDKYYRTLEAVDTEVGRVYDTLETLGYLKDTLFIILTDHGGVGTNHGGSDPREMNCTYIAKGKSVVPGEYTNAETGNVLTTASMSSVVAAALGVAQSGEYDYTVPDNYFKDYKYSAPTNDEWKIATPGEKYRNHKTADNSDEKISIHDYLDINETALNAFFKFDGNLNNEMPSGISAKGNGTVAYDDNGYYNGAVDLSNGYLTVDGLKNLGTGSFTVSMWLKDLNASQNDPALVSNKDWESGMNPGITIASEGGKFRFNLADGSSRSDTPYTSANGYTTDGKGGFVNLIAVVDRESRRAKLYADFRLIGSTSISVGSLDSAAGTTFVIGQDGKAAGFKAKFKLDEFMYFGTALDDGEISKLQAYYDAGNVTEDSEFSAKALEQVNKTYKAIIEIGEITEQNWFEKKALLDRATAAYTELREKYGDRYLANAADYERALADYETYKVDLVWGDADLNGKVEGNDALLILQHSVKLLELEGNALKVSKVSLEEGPISAVDALLVLQYSVGMIDKFPVEQ